MKGIIPRRPSPSALSSREGSGSPGRPCHSAASSVTLARVALARRPGPQRPRAPAPPGGRPGCGGDGGSEPRAPPPPPLLRSRPPPGPPPVTDSAPEPRVPEPPSQPRPPPPPRLPSCQCAGSAAAPLRTALRTALRPQRRGAAAAGRSRYRAGGAAAAGAGLHLQGRARRWDPPFGQGRWERGRGRACPRRLPRGGRRCGAEEPSGLWRRPRRSWRRGAALGAPCGVPAPGPRGGGQGAGGLHSLRSHRAAGQ